VEGPRPESSSACGQAGSNSNLQLTAEVFAPGKDKPVAQASITPPRPNGKVLVDLRTLGLKEARLVLKLTNGVDQENLNSRSPAAGWSAPGGKSGSTDSAVGLEPTSPPKQADQPLAGSRLSSAKTIGTSEIFLSAQDPEHPLKEGEKVKILIDVPEGVEKVEGWPVMVGVPFPAGALWDPGHVRLVDKNGKEIPNQKEVTGLWAPEGAIKWLRFDALVTSGQECFMEILPKVGRALAASPSSSVPSGTSQAKALHKNRLTLTEQDGKITIDTGVSTYILGKGISPIMEISLGGKQVAASKNTRGLYVTDQTGRTGSASAEEETMVVEANGPVASCVRFEGWYKTQKGENLARHITRVENFAGQPFAKITHTLVLTESTTNLWFKDIGWEFAVQVGSDPKAIFGNSRENWKESLAVPLSGATESAYMIQDDHYYFAHKTNHYTAAAVEKGGKAVVQKEGGSECGDWAAVIGRTGGLMLDCRETARQHPKEFEMRTDKIILHLFSSRAGEELDFRAETLLKKWDVETWYKQGGVGDTNSQARAIAWLKKITSDAAGWSKTHELQVIPLSATTGADEMARLSKLAREPVLAICEPAWLYKTSALGRLHPKDREHYPEVEKMVDALFQEYDRRSQEWGNFGFVDYPGISPQLEYRGKYARPYRYSIGYAWPLAGWLDYARCGERVALMRAVAQSRMRMDSLMIHWELPGRPKGYSVLPGISTEFGDSTFSLPFYWLTSGAQGAYPFNRFIVLIDDMNMWYYLTGYRRAADCLHEYCEGLKRYCSMTDLTGGNQVHNIGRLAACYELTWDPAIRDMARVAADFIYDQDAALHWSLNARGSDASKIGHDLRGLMKAAEVFDDPRCEDIAMKIAECKWGVQFWWGVPLLINCHCAGEVASFQYYAHNQDKTVAEGMALRMRMLPVAMDKKVFLDEDTAFFICQGIPAAEDILDQHGYGKVPITSWIVMDDLGFAPHSFYVFKKKGEALRLLNTGLFSPDCIMPFDKKTIAFDGMYGSNEAGGVWGAADSNQVIFSKEAPEGVYEIRNQVVTFADMRCPLVLYAPNYWVPGRVEPGLWNIGRPAIKIYFRVPKDARDAQIFFAGSAKLFDCQGNVFTISSGTNTTTLMHGWINLPPDKPGLWYFEPVVNRAVRVRNLPPFFAFDDPGSYFDPGVKWQRETIPPPAAKIPPGTVYIPGAISGNGNQALYLAGIRSFHLEGGAAHSSGNGRSFLPCSEGTIEFYFRPSWSSMERPLEVQEKYVGLMDISAPTAYFLALRLHGNSLRINLPIKGNPYIWEHQWGCRAIFERDTWYHVAVEWGYPTPAAVKHKILHSIIYINGKKIGDIITDEDAPAQYSNALRFRTNTSVANEPAKLVFPESLEGAIDELRISDCVRYTADFTPPDKELLLDEHTRALFHFNGNVEGQSHGQTKPVVGELK
jgi:hypothetical protein